MGKYLPILNLRTLIFIEYLCEVLVLIAEIGQNLCCVTRSED